MRFLLLLSLLLLGCSETKHYIEFQVTQSGSAWMGAEYYEFDDGTWYEEASKEFYFTATDGTITETNIPKTMDMLWQSKRGLWNLNTAKLKVESKHDGRTWFQGKYKPQLSYTYQLHTYEGSYSISQAQYLTLRKAQNDKKVITVEITMSSVSKIITN